MPADALSTASTWGPAVTGNVAVLGTALRWCAAGMIEAGKQFRRVNGHLRLPRLRTALDACFTENVGAASEGGNVRAT